MSKDDNAPAISDGDVNQNNDDKVVDDAILRQIQEEIEGERLLVAARLLKEHVPEKQWRPLHRRTVEKARHIQNVIDLHLAPPDQGWKKQSESHGHRDTIIYYKVDEGSKLTCRIETPIEASLLVPLLAVFNESQLYDTWMPHWEFPVRMGVRESLKVKEHAVGRGAHICQVTVDMPFPISDRQVIYDTFAVDCIDELSLISLAGVSLDVGTKFEEDDDDDAGGDSDGGFVIQPPESGVKRIDFDAGFCIRECPTDHPCLAKSKHKYPQDEHLLLLSLTQYVNAHVDYVPTTLINFTTRTALGGLWGSLLQVAQDVRSGERPDHTKVIEEKQELYGWVNQRIQTMVSKLDETNNHDKVEEEEENNAGSPPEGKEEKS